MLQVRDAMTNDEPLQHWIPFEDLDEEAQEHEVLWKCRTLLNNSSPGSFDETSVGRQSNAASFITFSLPMVFGMLLLFCINIVVLFNSHF